MTLNDLWKKSLQFFKCRKFQNGGYFLLNNHTFEYIDYDFMKCHIRFLSNYRHFKVDDYAMQFSSMKNVDAQ